MFSAENAFPIFAFSAFALFGGVLAWACWMEGREEKRKRAAQGAARSEP